MSNKSTYEITLLTLVRQKVEDYKTLTKVRLASLVVFSAATAYVAGQQGAMNWSGLALLCLAGFCVTGAANALNQVLEKDFDKLMVRTADRPLAAGRMETPEAVLAAGLLSGLGIMIFAIFFNPEAAMISTLSLISYAFVYTPMKRVSPAAVWIGAFPGAFPMMIGWVAATGHVGVEAWILFLIQFFWQFPHFWAIAWVSFDDYARGGFFLLPSKGGRDRATGLQCFLYSLVLLPLSFAPYMVGMTGLGFSIVMLIAGLGYSWYAWKLYRSCDHADARKLMFASFLYLPLVLLGLLFF